MRKILQKDSLAGIQYAGEPETTSSCVIAVARLIHFGDTIQEASLLTYKNQHCFLLYTNYDELIAVKSGFSSGYPGEGPRGLSTAIELLERHGTNIEEMEVPKELIQRIDLSSLLQSDIETLSCQHPVRPSRLYKYRLAIDDPTIKKHNNLNLNFPATIPFGLIDSRIMDLALQFDKNHDNAITSCYRRMEDIVRKRTALDSEHGAKLFSNAFEKENSVLTWDNLDPAEAKGRAKLFTATYMGFRNRRAHKEITISDRDALREFLLINQLFILESQSVKRTSTSRETNEANDLPKKTNI
jgi:hypothetical protein